MAAFVAAVLLLSTTALAQQRPGGWLKDATSGCQVWNLGAAPNESVRWSGGCVEGYGDGWGEMQWTDASKGGEAKATGTLKAGRPDGRWKIVRFRSFVTELVYANGELNGPYSWLYVDSSGSGTYVNGKRQGPYKLSGSCGDTETGTYVDDERSGAFTRRECDGTVVTGTLIHGRFEGIVTSRRVDGSGREDDYRDGKLVGTVRLFRADGSTYDGGWVGSRPNGTGTYRAPNDAVYTGPWTKGCYRQGDRQTCGFAQ
jgi:hypothetical protein